MREETLGRGEVAQALCASVVEPQIVQGMFGRPSLKIPRYAATLETVSTPVRVRDFGKGSAARINDGFRKPTFAELLVASKLRSAGWDSVWMSPFGGLRVIHEWAWDAVKPALGQLPDRVCKKLDSIAELRREKMNEGKARNGGIPDVIAWSHDDLLMIECKRAKADKLRRDQKAWIHCAVVRGIAIEQIGIFEWSFGAEV